MDTSKWCGFFNTPSMLKYCRNGEVKTIVADAKPFTMAEAHYADAKFYLKDALVENAQSTPDTKQQSKQKEKKVAFEEEEKIFRLIFFRMKVGVLEFDELIVKETVFRICLCRIFIFHSMCQLLFQSN